MVQSTLRITIATLQLRVITIHSKCTVTNSLANLGQQAILRNEKSSARKSFLFRDCISEAVQSGCTSNMLLEDRNQNVEILLPPDPVLLGNWTVPERYFPRLCRRKSGRIAKINNSTPERN